METLGYILFVVAFLVEAITVASHPPHLEPWLWVALGVASFRVARTISFNTVMGWLRAPFTKIVRDSSGAGDSVEADGKGLRYVIGDLLCCPICTGTYAAGILLSVYALLPDFGTALILILGAAGISESLHWHNEQAEWRGRQAREAAGTEWMAKHPAYYLETHRQGIEQDRQMVAEYWNGRPGIDRKPIVFEEGEDNGTPR